MRLASPHLRHVSAVTLFTVAASPAAFAAFELRAKTEGAALYRTEALEPPPKAALEEGEILTPLRSGIDRTQVRTQDGREGWMHNRDLVKVRLAEGSRHEIGEQAVTGSDFNHSATVLLGPLPWVETVALERSFAAEVAETRDREQVEMLHDEH